VAGGAAEPAGGTVVPPGPVTGDRVGRIVERLASRITEIGMPRMPARVLAALIASPDGALTAAGLGERLSISSGAVSTAVQSLIRIGLITREYVPGSRRDLYRIREDPWPEVFGIRSRWLLSFAETAAENAADLADESDSSSARLAEMREFALFVVPKLDEIVVAWREHRAGLAPS
jgi:DNA-binding transcriptional regulator GbsR (MarR family)